MGITKGEWIFVRLNAPTTHGIKVSDELFSSITSGNTVICLLPEPHYMPDTGDRTYYDGCVEIMRANGNLIKAAPELYEALKLYIEHQQGTRGHYCSVCHNEIEKALAKAEGK